MCVAGHVTQRKILLTTNWEGQQRSKSAHCANSTTARRTAHEVRRSRDTDKQIQQRFTSACLKHSNFFN